MAPRSWLSLRCWASYRTAPSPPRTTAAPLRHCGSRLSIHRRKSSNQVSLMSGVWCHTAWNMVLSFCFLRLVKHVPPADDQTPSFLRQILSDPRLPRPHPSWSFRREALFSYFNSPRHRTGGGDHSSGCGDSSSICGAGGDLSSQYAHSFSSDSGGRTCGYFCPSELLLSPPSIASRARPSRRQPASHGRRARRQGASTLQSA